MVQMNVSENSSAKRWLLEVSRHFETDYYLRVREQMAKRNSVERYCSEEELIYGKKTERRKLKGYLEGTGLRC
jgi:hypothetical protein